MPLDNDLRSAVELGGIRRVISVLAAASDSDLSTHVWQTLEALVTAFAAEAATAPLDEAGALDALRAAVSLCSRVSPREVVAAVLERASCRDPTAFRALPLILQLILSSATFAAAGPRPFKSSFLQSLVSDVAGLAGSLGALTPSWNAASLCFWARGMARITTVVDVDIRAGLAGLACMAAAGTDGLGVRWSSALHEACRGVLFAAGEGPVAHLTELYWASRGFAVDGDGAWAANAWIEAQPRLDVAGNQAADMHLQTLRLETKGAIALTGLGLMLVEDFSLPGSSQGSTVFGEPSALEPAQLPSLWDVAGHAVAPASPLVPRVLHPQWLAAVALPPLAALLQMAAQHAAGVTTVSFDDPESPHVPQAAPQGSASAGAHVVSSRALALVEQLLAAVPAVSMSLNVRGSLSIAPAAPPETLVAQAAIALAVHSEGSKALQGAALRVLQRLIAVLWPGAQRVVLRALLESCPYRQAQALLLDLVRAHVVVGARAHDPFALSFATQLLLQRIARRVGEGLTEDVKGSKAGMRSPRGPLSDNALIAAHLAECRDVDSALLALLRALLLQQAAADRREVSASGPSTPPPSRLLSPNDVAFVTSQYVRPLSFAVSECLRMLAPPASLTPHQEPFSSRSSFTLALGPPSDAVARISAGVSVGSSGVLVGCGPAVMETQPASHSIPNHPTGAAQLRWCPPEDSSHLLSSIFLLDAALTPVVALL